MNIIVYPNDSGRNSYINIHKSIWKSGGFDIYGIKSGYKKIVTRKNNIGIINWLEDRVIGSTFEALVQFFVALSVLILMRCLCKKLVYVKHNYRPHKYQSHNAKRLHKILVGIIDRACDVSCNHLKNLSLSNRKESRYVSHPLYLRHEPLDDKERNIDYLVFGRIDEYKGIVELLNYWPKDKLLYLMGKASSEQLKHKINDVIVRRGLNVIWKNKYISDADLNQMLLKTKYVILSHMEGSMLVSGAFYHAISFGVNVVGISNNFIEENAKKFPFVHNFSLIDLEGGLSNVNCVRSHNVIETTYENYNDGRIMEQWIEIFEY